MRQRESGNRVGALERGGGREPLSLQSHDAYGGFHRSRRTQEMADAAFGRADGQVRGMISRPPVNCRRFRTVVQNRPGAVGVDVADLARVKPSTATRFCHGAPNAAVPSGFG